MTENKNVNNQDDALKDTVNPDMENKQEPVDEQPKQEEAAEAKEAKGDNVSEKKSKRFKIRHAQQIFTPILGVRQLPQAHCKGKT